MKKMRWLLAAMCCLGAGKTDESIRLLVRADDMGASRSANLAIIKSYSEGIVTAVEVMVPGPWFEEAASLLNEHPDLDVGIHLTLTSEWNGVKWRPLTNCPSIIDEDGYFFPFVHKNANAGEARSIVESKWDIREIEQELRAQIELAIKRIPHITHLSQHMGCLNFSEETKQLYIRLAEAYGLSVEMQGLSPFSRWSGSDRSVADKKKKLLSEINQLAPGTYLLVEHPAFDDRESQGMGHVGYEHVAADRSGVLEALIDKKVLKAVTRRGIRLISYRDLRRHR